MFLHLDRQCARIQIRQSSVARSIWGATYVTYLFEFLQLLEWIPATKAEPDQCTQWMEL